MIQTIKAVILSTVIQTLDEHIFDLNSICMALVRIIRKIEHFTEVREYFIGYALYSEEEEEEEEEEPDYIAHYHLEM
jgi:hypothetical protein